MVDPTKAAIIPPSETEKWGYQNQEAEAEKYHRDTEMSTCSEIRHENKMKYV